MKLNIETTDAAATLKVLRRVFTNEEVDIVDEYNYTNTADYEIKPPGVDEHSEFVYSAESVIELAAVIPPHKIRIY